ncbi:TonB-dependent receptor [Gaopeijia maritima]|uniref:TonB-dependent receptor n=1 Tax=Gaopeijia maritima TaxID=3119007 RepID=UPI0032818BE1
MPTPYPPRIAPARGIVLLAVLALVTALAGLLSPLTAQQTAVTGLVRDDVGNPLPGATVRLEGEDGRTSVGDADGAFRFVGVAPGEYTLSATYLGYSAASATVTVMAGATSTAVLVMQPAPLEVEGITTYGELTRGQAQALNAQKNSPNLKYVISEELFDLYPDINAAETVQRLPGVSIARDQGEGRFVQVRGLGEQFNSLTVNGVRLPSIGRGSERAVELDIVPSSMVEEISVTKALRPDMDGDALGGTVDMVYKRPGSEPFLHLDLGGGLNDQQSEIDSWGQGIVSVSGNAGTRFADDRLGILVAGSYHDTERGSLFESWRYVEDEGGELSRHRTTDYDVGRKNMGLLSSLDLQYSDTGELTFAVNWQHYLEDEIRRLAIYNIGPLTEQRFTGNRVREQDMLFAQVAGDQQFGRARLEFQGSWSQGEEDWPDITEFRWTRSNPMLAGLSDAEIDDLGAMSTFNGVDAPLTLDYAYFYPTSVESGQQSAGADLTVLAGGSGNSSFKVGGRFTSADRTYLFSSVRSTPTDPSTFTIEGGTFGLPEVKFDDPEIGQLGLSSPLTPADPRTNASSYEAEERTLAGYLMNTTDWSDRFTTMVGVRVERTSHDYLQFSTGNEGEGSYTSVLPSAHGIVRLDPNSQVRFAVSRGLSRPSFRSLVPVDVVDEEDLEISRGNPELEPTTAWSFDLMFERYGNQLGFLSGGLFYKKLQDPIAGGSYTESVGGTQYTVFQPLNGGSATVYGFEVAAYQRLSALGLPLFRHLALNANYTWNHSEADFGSEREREYPLPNSPEHTGNLSLIYENPNAGFTTVVAGNYRSYMWEKFEGGQLHNDIWTGSEFHLDVSMRKDWTRGLSTYLQLNNLTNESDREIQGEPSESFSRIHERESYSWWATLGVRVTR